MTSGYSTSAYGNSTSISYQNISVYEGLGVSGHYVCTTCCNYDRPTVVTLHKLAMKCFRRFLFANTLLVLDDLEVLCLFWCSLLKDYELRPKYNKLLVRLLFVCCIEVKCKYFNLHIILVNCIC